MLCALHRQDGWTPLHFAVQFGEADMVAALLASGGDRSRKTNVRIRGVSGISYKFNFAMFF